MLNIAVRAARAGGNLLLRYYGRTEALSVAEKRRNDFVSEVDRLAEQEIIGVIRKAYPSHGILAEETGSSPGDAYIWVIDPLDGTTNYLHGFPQFCVSIALKHKGSLEQAVVYDPLKEELFTASRGAGALLNDRRIRVSKHRSLDGALLGTGFPFRDHQFLDQYLGMFRTLIADTSGIRRAGSAALDFAYVASGRLDGFWELGLAEWDFAAGVLLVNEAGGSVSDLSGGAKHLASGNVIAGNIKVHEALRKAIAPHLDDRLSH